MSSLGHHHHRRRIHRQRFKMFAYRNAYTLTFLAVFGFVVYALLVWEKVQ